VRSERNRRNCRDRRHYDRTYRKFYGFVYRLQNNCLKKHERQVLRYQLSSTWLKCPYDPLVYISQEDIDRHFKNSLWEKDDYPFNCIEVIVDDPFACPYTGHGAVRHQAWVIRKPGYYRVSVSFSTIQKSNSMRTHYTMKHYRGMPYFNYDNDRCHNNYVSRAFHKVLDFYSHMERQIHNEIWLTQQTKIETYNRLKNKQIMRKFMEREQLRKREKRVRGVIITQETKSFFQALAIGSIFKKEAA